MNQMGYDSINMKNAPKALNNKDGVNNSSEDQQLQMFNQLCQKTPEGYLITLEQRQFEGKESYLDMGKDDQNTGKDKRYNVNAGLNKGNKEKKDKPM